jgi:flagellar protein FlaG
MSVINSDMSKSAVAPLVARPDQQLESEAFKVQQQQNAKVVLESADSNKSQAKSQQDQAQDKEASLMSVDRSLVAESAQKMRQLNVHLSFELSENGNDNVVKVVDQETGDVVRQIPTEEFLKFSEKLDDILGQLSDLKGSLVNSEV